MEYKKSKDKIYLRMDKDEEITKTIKTVCEKENIKSGFFQGIGACDRVVLSTWVPEKNNFIHHTIEGMIEMVSLMGNISCDSENMPFLHSHGVFSYLNESGEVLVAGGHLYEAYISYTGEMILTAADEKIGRKTDEKTGIEIWEL